MNINHLTLSWSTSKGRDTYGYNICRLDDRNMGKRYKCMGGGYDMVGTVFGEWLQENYQAELKQLAVMPVGKLENAGYAAKDIFKIDGMYGYNVRFNEETKEFGKVTLDGACGLESMLKIAEAIGLEVEREYVKTGRNRGQTIGWYVQMTDK